MGSLEPNDRELAAYWMPFTHNRYFKQHHARRMLAKAEGAYYWSTEGEKLFDALSGLWCSGLGHRHPKIVEAVKQQLDTVDYSPAFQMGYGPTFKLAERIVGMSPAGMGQVFFVNSGSEAVDTSMKMALAYHRAKGEASRTRFIGREKGYHGVGFGGISVGGMVANRKMYPSAMLVGVDHLPHTHNLKEMAFTRGEPTWGLHLANELERLVALHDASTIAAVIVEPMQGSTGVVVPPKGYLQRLREICTKNGILLIFDEVITGFGRLGHAFAAERYGVVPDMITFAKGVTSGSVPMGGVIVRKGIHDAFMSGPEHVVEFFHGYTYSAHPLACAAGLAALDLYRDEDLFGRAKRLEPMWADAIMGLKGTPGVLDIRTVGLVAAIDLASIPDKAGARAYAAMEMAFHDENLIIRVTGDTIALTPPLIVSDAQVGEIFDKVARTIRAVAH